MNQNKICLVPKVTGLIRHSKGDGGMEGLGGGGFEVPRGPLVTPILKADHSELIVLKLTEICKITGKYSEVYVKGGGGGGNGVHGIPQKTGEGLPALEGISLKKLHEGIRGGGGGASIRPLPSTFDTIHPID